MLRQYHASRRQGGYNPLGIGVIPAGAIFYLQDDGWWRDRFRGAPPAVPFVRSAIRANHLLNVLKTLRPQVERRGRRSGSAPQGLKCLDHGLVVSLAARLRIEPPTKTDDEKSHTLQLAHQAEDLRPGWRTQLEGLLRLPIQLDRRPPLPRRDSGVLGLR